MKLNMDYYKNLPYDIDVLKFQEEIDKLLKHYEKKTKNIEEEMSLMCELTAKAYPICKNIDKDVKNSLEKWLYESITNNPEYPLELCFCIAERFSLQKVITFLRGELREGLIKKQNTAMYYRSLTDYYSKDYLEEEFKRILNIVKHEDYDILDILDSLCELSYRVVNVYEEIDEILKQELEKWIIQVMDFNSKKNISSASYIILLLELRNAYIFIKEKMLNQKDGIIKKELQEMIDEFELTI